MPQYPTYSLYGGNQNPAVALAAPSQYPVIALVDAAGVPVEIGGGGDVTFGEWTSITLIGTWVQSGEVEPAFMVDSLGYVHWRGSITGTAAPGAQICNAVELEGAMYADIGTLYFHWQLPPHAGNVTAVSAPSMGMGAGHLAEDIVDLSHIPLYLGE